MNTRFFQPVSVCFLLAFIAHASAQDRVFSGPQVGERTTPFVVFDVTGPHAGKDVDYIKDLKGAPAVLVFVHGLERSILPLMRVIDQYGWDNRNKVNTLFVFLTTDRVDSERRLPIVQKSTGLQSPFTISLDGPEGPGNYGLNKTCLLTILVANENKVVANFALVQPGISDARRVIPEIARVIGDPKPPTAEELETRRRESRPDSPRSESPANPEAMRRRSPPLDLSKFDLATEDGLRAAVRALLAEVASLRREIDELRGQSGQRRPTPDAKTEARQEIPGAAPTDAKLLSQLRAFIQPSNDDKDVDRILADIESYVKGNSDLTRQAIDGWTRVLFLKYGTEYAQRSGKTFVERLKK